MSFHCVVVAVVFAVDLNPGAVKLIRGSMMYVVVASKVLVAVGYPGTEWSQPASYTGTEIVPVILQLQFLKIVQ